MFNPLLINAFRVGNLELVIKLKEVKEIDLNLLIPEIKNIDLEAEGYIWRFQQNLKLIITQTDILQNYDSIFLILENFITFLQEKDKIIFSKYLDIENLEEGEKNSLVILSIIDDLRIKLKTEQHDNQEIAKIYQLFIKRFSFHINYLNKKILILDHNYPYDDNVWTPYWKLSIDGKTIILEDINIYLDIYLIFNNIKFNFYMKNIINILTRRIKRIKKSLYYQTIKNKINKFTEKIFNIFPYSIIYKDYRGLLLEEESVYRSELMKKINIKSVSDEAWLLSILPRYLIAYLLGFPVISADVPSYNNIMNYLETINQEGYQKYINLIRERNRNKIKNLAFDIDCANHIDEDGDATDLIFNKVVDYNMDDFILIFNNDIYHLFTAPEFKNLIKKEENPYNRGKMPLISSILDNIRFKKKLIRNLNNRYLEVDFNQTLLENFDELRQKIQAETVEKKENKNLIIPNPILDLIFRSYNSV